MIAPLQMDGDRRAVPVVPRPPVPAPALVRSGHIEIMSERRVPDGSFIRVRLHCDG